MSRLVQLNPVLPRGQFFDRPGRGGAVPAITQNAEGTPKTPMGPGEVTTNAEGSEQLQPGGPWAVDTWCGEVTTGSDDSKTIRTDRRVPPPEPSRSDPRLFHYAGKQWHIRREIFNGNLLFLLDLDVINDPDSFANSSVDVANHWVSLYRVSETSFAALTRQDSSFHVRAFDRQITGETAALDISTTETTDALAELAEARLHAILSAGDTGRTAIDIDDHPSYTNIWLNGHRVSVDYKSRFQDGKDSNSTIAAALGLLPIPFLKLIDTIFFTAEMPDSHIANLPGGVTVTPPIEAPLYMKRYVDLRAVQDAKPSAIARGLLFESAHAFLTHNIALVPEADGWQIVPYKPVHKEKWQRPADFVSDLDAAWMLAIRADQRHPQLIRNTKRIFLPLADAVAQGLSMIIGDEGGVNRPWVAQNPHQALFYSTWLSKVHTEGLLLPGEINGALERSVWLFLQNRHSEA